MLVSGEGATGKKLLSKKCPKLSRMQLLSLRSSVQWPRPAWRPRQASRTSLPRRRRIWKIKLWKQWVKSTVLRLQKSHLSQHMSHHHWTKKEQMRSSRASKCRRRDVPSSQPKAASMLSLSGLLWKQAGLALVNWARGDATKSQMGAKYGPKKGSFKSGFESCLRKFRDGPAPWSWRLQVKMIGTWEGMVNLRFPLMIWEFSTSPQAIMSVRMSPPIWQISHQENLCLRHPTRCSRLELSCVHQECISSTFPRLRILHCNVFHSLVWHRYSTNLARSMRNPRSSNFLFFHQYPNWAWESIFWIAICFCGTSTCNKVDIFQVGFFDSTGVPPPCPHHLIFSRKRTSQKQPGFSSLPSKFHPWELGRKQRCPVSMMGTSNIPIFVCLVADFLRIRSHGKSALNHHLVIVFQPPQANQSMYFSWLLQQCFFDTYVQ